MNEVHDAALGVLRGAHEALRATLDAEREAVRAARALPVAWRDIAEAVGMKEPNAIRKYGATSTGTDTALAVKPAPTEVGNLRDNALRRIREIIAARKTADDMVTQAVADARNVSVTWQKIADTLGTRQPNTIQKYKPKLLETRKVRVAPTPRGSKGPATR